MGVARVDKPGERVGFVRAFFRSLLTLFLLPPAITDSDMRGMHDRATGTAVILGERYSTNTTRTWARIIFMIMAIGYTVVYPIAGNSFLAWSLTYESTAG